MTRSEYKRLINIEVLKDTRPNSILRVLRILKSISLNPSAEAIFYIRKMQYFASGKNKFSSFLAKRYHMKLVHRFSMCIAPNAIIGEGLHIPHPVGIVIGNACVIGKNCSIYQNSTVGGVRTGDVKKGNQPQIGDNVTIFCSSMVLGKIKVADGCIVGANSVLLSDASDAGSTYVGSPARKVEK